MSTHIFKYCEELDVFDEGRDISYTLHYRYIPSTEYTWETRGQDARIIPVAIEYCNPDTGKVVILNRDTEDLFIAILEDFDVGDIITETQGEIMAVWDERDRNKPEDTPSLDEPWWKVK